MDVRGAVAVFNLMLAASVFVASAIAGAVLAVRRVRRQPPPPMRCGWCGTAAADWPGLTCPACGADGRVVGLVRSRSDRLPLLGRVAGAMLVALCAAAGSAALIAAGYTAPARGDVERVDFKTATFAPTVPPMSGTAGLLAINVRATCRNVGDQTTGGSAEVVAYDNAGGLARTTVDRQTLRWRPSSTAAPELFTPASLQRWLAGVAGSGADPDLIAAMADVTNTAVRQMLGLGWEPPMPRSLDSAGQVPQYGGDTKTTGRLPDTAEAAIAIPLWLGSAAWLVGVAVAVRGPRGRP